MKDKAEERTGTGSRKVGTGCSEPRENCSGMGKLSVISVEGLVKVVKGLKPVTRGQVDLKGV